jgi:hypothetical protein
MWLAGLLSALGLLFLIFKFGIRRVISYDIPVDIAVTILLMYVFAGTYSGMMAAMVGGLIVSVTLFIMKRTMVREVLTVRKRNVQLTNRISIPLPEFRWVVITPA